MGAASGMDPMGIVALSSDNPNAYANYLALQRRQQLAQALFQQGSQGVEGINTGRVYVDPPLRHAAAAAQQILGAYLMKQNIGEQAQMMQGALGGGQQQPAQNQPQAPQWAGQGLDASAMPAGSPAPTASTAAQMAPQINAQMQAQQQQPQQSQQPSLIPSIPGVSRQESMIRYMQDAPAYMGAYYKSLEQTPEMKDMAAAYGAGSPQYNQAIQDYANKQSMSDARPGATVLQGTRPVFSAPATPPQGSRIVYDAQGNPSIVPVPGGTAAISAATTAEAYPKAQANVWEANQSPKIINQGAGDTFATPTTGPQSIPQPGAPLAGRAAVNDVLHNGDAPNSVAGISGQVPPSPVSTAQLSSTPTGLAWQKGEAAEAFQKVQDSGNAAQDAHGQLMMLKTELAGLPAQTGWFTPGAHAGARVDIAKAVNSSLAASGMKPWFDPKQVASAEATIKTGTRLGFSLSRTLGSREAAQIVTQAIGANPGIANTPQGNDLMIRSLDAAQQREADKAAFTTKYLAANGNTLGADQAFNRQFPVQSYVAAAQANDKARSLLSQHPNLAPQFDQQFGPGASQRVLYNPWGP